MEGKSTFRKAGHYKKANKMRNDSSKYKKFVGNRAEGQGFADKRKKKIQYEYMKMLRKENKKGHSQSSPQNAWLRRDEDEIEEEEMTARYAYTHTENRQLNRDSGRESDNKDVGDTRLGGDTDLPSTSTYQHTNTNYRKQNRKEFKKEGKNVFSKAMHEAKMKKHESDRRHEQIEKQKQEKETALQKYKTKKRDNYFKFHCKRTSKGQPVMKYQMEFLLQKIEKQRELDKKNK